MCLLKINIYHHLRLYAGIRKWNFNIENVILKTSFRSIIKRISTFIGKILFRILSLIICSNFAKRTNIYSSICLNVYTTQRTSLTRYMIFYIYTLLQKYYAFTNTHLHSMQDRQTDRRLLMYNAFSCMSIKYNDVNTYMFITICVYAFTKNVCM